MNAIGFAGLASGIRFILDTGISAIREKEDSLTTYFINSLKERNGIRIYGTDDLECRTSVVSFNINGIASSDAAFIFDEEYGILSRPGLHCSPSAHRTLGTFPGGTNRFSFGFYNTYEEIDISLKAVDKILRGSL